MEPTRDPNATLPDLLEVLLNKGSTSIWTSSSPWPTSR